jgi:hypothetical protein
MKDLLRYGAVADPVDLIGEGSRTISTFSSDIALGSIRCP